MTPRQIRTFYMTRTALSLSVSVLFGCAGAKTKTETKPTPNPAKSAAVEQSVHSSDLNEMNEEHFEFVGFPEETAREVVRYREEHGPYHSLKDLKQVPGVTDSMINGLKTRLSAESLADQ